MSYYLLHGSSLPPDLFMLVIQAVDNGYLDAKAKKAQAEFDAKRQA